MKTKGFRRSLVPWERPGNLSSNAPHAHWVFGDCFHMLLCSFLSPQHLQVVPLWNDK